MCVYIHLNSTDNAILYSKMIFKTIFQVSELIQLFVASHYMLNFDTNKYVADVIKFKVKLIQRDKKVYTNIYLVNMAIQEN
jgi:hypothetical protein